MGQLDDTLSIYSVVLLVQTLVRDRLDVWDETRVLSVLSFSSDCLRTPPGSRRIKGWSFLVFTSSTSRSTDPDVEWVGGRTLVLHLPSPVVSTGISAHSAHGLNQRGSYGRSGGGITL